jgi:hypothetical protein
MTITNLSVVMVVDKITRKVRRQFLVPMTCQAAEVYLSTLNDEESMDGAESLIRHNEDVVSYPVEFERGVMEI